jgi:hypothetical protein
MLRNLSATGGDGTKEARPLEPFDLFVCNARHEPPKRGLYVARSLGFERARIEMSLDPAGRVPAPRLVGGFEAVADVADGLNEDRLMGIFFQFGSKGGYTPIDAAAGYDDGIAPDCVENVIPGEGAAAASHQVAQQRELLGGQF